MPSRNQGNPQQGKVRVLKNKYQVLGYVIDSDGFRPDPDKVKAILSVKTPQIVGDVCRFLEMVNQMNKFCPNLADITKPLRDLLIKDNLWT